ncbi:MAG TPA: UvrD-helicase domain-containing protein, partial [bacterium]|nr:UvrD-helicase domain-containing protein [bacterium]
MKKYRIQPPAGRAPVSRIDYASALNEEQKAVVTRGSGPALVIAGAGSGKTRVITYRVAWLIEQGVAPDSILLMTFTNKAAREMLGRVDALTAAGAAKRVMGGTFHHVANVLLRAHAASIGFSSGFTILDEEDRSDVLQSVLGECAERWKESKLFGDKDPLTERRFPSAAVLGRLISDAINRQTNLSALLAANHPYFADLAEPVAEVAKAFAARKRERDLMDFDDLLLWWKILLERDDKARESKRARFQHELVDEYQDTNKLQADIVDALA